MTTAVLDLDINNLPLTISGLQQYDKAFVLIRLNGYPVGRTILPVSNGEIACHEFHDVLIQAAGQPLQNRWLCNYLNWDETQVEGFSIPRATVAVCTRDRPEDLKRCLDALIGLPDDGQEFLVIDNCPSTEATRQLVKSYSRVKYIREERPGLDIARNRALCEASHEIVAFTDDDAAPDPLWLRALLRNFSDPLVLCVTGLVMPLELETEVQEWFEQYAPFCRGFNRTIFDLTRRNPLAVGSVGAGASMALRRSVLEKVGCFDEALDAGTPTCSGGDHEMFARIMTSGYRIVYDPAALSWHRHRRTWQELCRAFYGYGAGNYARFARHLLLEKEFSILQIMVGWFVHDQFPALMRSLLRRPNSMPLGLILKELEGCAHGFWAYLVSRRKLHATTSEKNSKCQLSA